MIRALPSFKACVLNPTLELELRQDFTLYQLVVCFVLCEGDTLKTFENEFYEYMGQVLKETVDEIIFRNVACLTVCIR